MRNKILIVDDDVNLNRLLSNFLGKNGYEPFPSFSAEDAITKMAGQQFDIVLTDLRMPRMDGIQLLQWVNEHQPDCCTILMTSYAEVQTAVKAIKLGAFDYIAKPIVPDDLLKKIQDALQSKSRMENVKMEKENPILKTDNHIGKTSTKKKKDTDLDDRQFIEGVSSSALRLKEHILLVAPTPISVLISGESGTGKEYIARLIHHNSKYAQGPFVAVDCGSIPKDLAGSELFGHKKGAFTGAVSDKTGFFQQAEGGTLFFDEIENLPYSVQIYLLRALQEKRIRPVGGERDIETNVRVLAATNINLQTLCEKGEFRADLFHRLNEFSIQAIPLRDRKEDIFIFAEKFLEKANRDLEKEVPVTGLTSEVKEIFLQYSWPGNIRELLYTIKRACLLSRNEYIEPDDLPAEIIDSYRLSQNPGSDKNSQPTISLAKEEQERILNCLREVNYNKSKAARILNMDRKTLYNKLKSYGIEL